MRSKCECHSSGRTADPPSEPLLDTLAGMLVQLLGLWVGFALALMPPKLEPRRRSGGDEEEEEGAV
jgi:hypothetical protein